PPSSTGGVPPAGEIPLTQLDSNFTYGTGAVQQEAPALSLLPSTRCDPPWAHLCFIAQSSSENHTVSSQSTTFRLLVARYACSRRHRLPRHGRSLTEGQTVG